MTRPLRHLVPLRVRRPLGRGGYELASAVRRGSGSLRHALGGLPLLAARDLVYDDSFYEEIDRESMALHERLADALVELWARARSSTSAALGSSARAARPRRSQGPGSRGQPGRSPSRPSFHPGRAGEPRAWGPGCRHFDRCLCLEVAEHLRPRSGPRFVTGLSALSDTIVFTAAQPGQPGTSHLNTSPTQYWRSLVAEAGLTSGAREGELASAIADVPEPAYSTRTSWSSSVPLDSRIRK